MKTTQRYTSPRSPSADKPLRAHLLMHSGFSLAAGFALAVGFAFGGYGCAGKEFSMDVKADVKVSNTKAGSANNAVQEPSDGQGGSAGETGSPIAPTPLDGGINPTRQDDESGGDDSPISAGSTSSNSQAQAGQSTVDGVVMHPSPIGSAEPDEASAGAATAAAGSGPQDPCQSAGDCSAQAGGSSDSDTMAPEDDAGSMDLVDAGIQEPTTSGDQDQHDAATCAAQDCSCAADTRCATLSAHLLHRYSFSGDTDLVTDTVGDADGQIYNGLTAGGVLEFDGEDTFVELPAGRLSGLVSTTIEVWTRWNGGGDSPRIFNFGSLVAERPSDSTYVSLTPSRSSDGLLTFGVYTDAALGPLRLQGMAALDTDAFKHVVTIIDGDNGQAQLFVEGELVATEASQHPLSALDEEFAWLGRSLNEQYSYFDGAISEFRIYDSALPASAVLKSFELGPDASF